MAAKKCAFVGNPSAPASKASPEKRKVMIVCPASWSIHDLDEMKDQLEEHVTVTTFRDSGELQMSDITAVLPRQDLFILILAEHHVSWCNMNRVRLEHLSKSAGVECKVLQSTNVDHVVSLAA